MSTGVTTASGVTASGIASIASPAQASSVQNPIAFSGNTSLTVTWLTPVTGNPSSYTVTLSPGGATQTVSGLSATFTGLTNGTAYTATIVANNAYGSGTSVSASAVTPSTAAAVLSAVTSANLFAWYAADQIPGPPANNANISSWSDFSGNGYNTAVTPNTGTFVSSWTNSKPAILWTGASGGSGTYMVLPFGLNNLGGIFTFFWVGDLTAATNAASQNDMRVISNNLNAGGKQWAIDGFGNGSTTNTFRQLWSVNSMQSAATSTATPYVLSCVYGLAANSGGFAYINGTKQTTNDGHLSAQSEYIKNLVLGADPDFNRVWKGRMAEVIFYAGALTDTDRHTIEAILGTKYNITMAVQ